MAEFGAATTETVATIEAAVARFDGRLSPADVEAAGNPVLPLVRALRFAIADERSAAVLHRGLTSQDVLDSALMLLARDALTAVASDLDRIAAVLANLAETHRYSLMAGRTLTQYAVPTTFGLRAAQWLLGVIDAREAIGALRAQLPVQCGGAAGTLALACETIDDPVRAARLLAERLGLSWPGLPWHTRRTPVTRLGDALAATCDALGHIAGDLLVLGRPEIAEARETTAEGHGVSSTMPHKKNPTLAILVRSAALQAPLRAAQLHLAASQSIDERPPGDWHAEWPALRGLIELTVTAASLTADLIVGLEIDVEAMWRRANANAAELLSERGGGEEPASYLGVADTFIDEALGRERMRRD